LKSALLRFLPSDLDPAKEMTITSRHITRIWKQAKERTLAFWNDWFDAYFQYLRTTHHNVNKFPKNTFSFQPKENTIVLIAEPNIKCPNWRLGRIIKLNRSKDEEIRSADIKLANGHWPGYF